MATETNAAEPGSIRLPRPAVLALAVATLAMVVYSPAIGGGFIYDDWPLIARNLHAHTFHDWKRWFSTDFWDVNEGIKHFGSRLIYWRPLVSASYVVDWKIGGGAPVMFHVTNTIWSGVAGFLAFVTLRRWIGAILPAFLAAALFIVHPTKAESVAWIAGRTDVMCLVTILIASHGAARRLRGERGGLALEIVGTILSYAVKEQALVLPAFVGVEAWVALGRPAIDRATIWKIVKAAIPQLVVGIAYLAIRAKWLPVVDPKNLGISGIAHVWLVLETMGRYFVLTVLPHDLSVQEGLLHSKGTSWVFSPRYIAIGAIGLVAAAGYAFTLRRKNPLVTVGIAFFFATVLPTSNVVNTSMMTILSERFLYLPMLGLALAVGGLVLHVAPRFERPAILATVLVTIAFAVVAARHSDDFGDEASFWSRELALHPDSIEALSFARNQAIEERRFRRALEIDAEAESVAARFYSHTGSELDFTIVGAEILSRLIPDHEKASLEALQRFYATLLDPGATEARLTVRDLEIVVPLGRRILATRIIAQRPRILAYSADLASRLGDDAKAIPLATQAITECAGCSEITRLYVVVQARAGHYDLASAAVDVVAAEQVDTVVKPLREMLARALAAARDSAAAPPGPLKVKARAEELMTLEAWGRAYDVLAPFRGPITQVPELAVGFAQLAFRAGEPQVAREVLATGVPGVNIEATIRDWSKQMGWLDAGPGATTP